MSTARVIALLSLGLNGSDLLSSEEKIAFAGCRKLGILQLYANESDMLPAESQSVRRVCDLEDSDLSSTATEVCYSQT